MISVLWNVLKIALWLACGLTYSLEKMCTLQLLQSFSNTNQVKLLHSVAQIFSFLLIFWSILTILGKDVNLSISPFISIKFASCVLNLHYQEHIFLHLLEEWTLLSLWDTLIIWYYPLEVYFGINIIILFFCILYTWYIFSILLLLICIFI